MSNALLKRIIKAENNLVILQDLQIRLRRGESINLLAPDIKGRTIRTLEDICESTSLDNLIKSGDLTLWDENGIQLTSLTALRATNIATLKDVDEATGTGGTGTATYLINADGGKADSIYEGIPIIDGGNVDNLTDGLPFINGSEAVDGGGI